MATPTAAAPARTAYALLAELDYAGHHLKVTETVTYVNNSSGASMPDLVLLVEANREPDLFSLGDVRWSANGAQADYALDGATLRVQLPRPLAPGAHAVLFLSYTLAIPARAAPLGYTARQTNLGDWYPYVPPYAPGSGWAVHPPAAVGEHLSYDVADYRVEIRLSGTVRDLVVAASGLVRMEEDRLGYRLEAARSFAWSASPEYVLTTQAMGSTTVASYAFPEHRSAGEATLRTTAQAAAVYGRLFGAYPHDQLVVVEAEFVDGMEYDGMYFLGSAYYAAYAGEPTGWLTVIAAHETAHQWWYGLVGNDQALEPWLDETLCTYSERLFFQAHYPDLVDWWHGFRIERYAPAGWVDSTVYDHTGFRPYVDAVYLRGAMFLSDLRTRMGEAAFLDFLGAYARRYRNGWATTQGFLSLLAERSTEDAGDLVRAYFGQAP
jgi:hypothetical protein